MHKNSKSDLLAISYQVRNENIVSEAFEGEMVVLDLETGRYFSLNPSAAKLWSSIICGHTFNKFNECAPMLEHFIGSLLEYNLIVPSINSAVNQDAIELDSSAPTPQIEVFDDLSDLFMADPIHDVDIAKGWPHKN